MTSIKLCLLIELQKIDKLKKTFVIVINERE
jgi:hypothetical protein